MARKHKKQKTGAIDDNLFKNFLGTKLIRNVWPTDIVQTQNGPSAQTALDSQNGPSVHSSFVQNGPLVYSSCVQNGPSVHLACVAASLSWGAILALDNIG